MTLPSRRPLAAALLALWTCTPVLAQQALRPRQLLDPGPVVAPALPRGATADVERRLVVKLRDEVRGRVRADGRLDSSSAASLAEIEAVAQAWDVRFERLISLPEETLAALQERAARRSGRAQPDLAGLLRVVADGRSVSDLEALGQALQACREVEFVSLQTEGLAPPADVAPPTPDLSVNQVYLQPDPGADVLAAWNQGLRGAGIRLSDCEYGWNGAHEDLVDVDLHPEPGQTVHPNVALLDYDDHGTSVLGVLGAPSNGYGVTGIAREATLATYTEWSVEEGLRRVTAVAHAIADSAPGDVVLLEMQTLGPGGDMAPAEVDPALFLVVQAGTDAGVVVVAAAGNGNQNLDSSPYFFYREMGDSGAILVGAGTADTHHDKMPFSTYGARVDVQAWGHSVFTLGGGFLVLGGDPNQTYTNAFNGTSSASALVAAYCCLLQQAAKSVGGAPLSPRDLRYLLGVTGKPQGLGGHIGAHPDLAAALAKLPDMFVPRWNDLGGGSFGSQGVPALQGQGDLTPGTLLGLSLQQGAPGALAFVWISASSAAAPFLGGTLHAFPFFSQIPVLLDGAGSVSGTAHFPPGFAPGTQVWWQAGVVDPSVSPGGGALSNALLSTTP